MKILTTLLLILLPFTLPAAPKADAWPHWQPRTPSVEAPVDHASWSAFLDRYVDRGSQPYRVAYGRVSADDRASLQAYLAQLQGLKPQAWPRAAQMAYWINLYNAATVELILDHYPVRSITRIKSGLFSFGPWDKKLLDVDGHKLSLNDIEHRILRPLFQDPRIHYAVNCASLGCPDLAPSAYTADTLEEMLDAGARRYVNHPRGVSIEDDRLIVSSIYVWFASDFGGSDAAVIAHLQRYADTELKSRLMRQKSIHDDRYDWALNDLP